jgi:hypothetical protein
MNKFILLLVFLTSSAVAEEVDNRQSLNLTEPQRNHVLGEMRALLTGTQNILAALAKDDMSTVAEHTQALGVNMEHKAENPLHEVLPKDFMQLGMSMHKDFDLIAADAATLKNPKHTLQQLSDTMAKCTACHATYQIRQVNVSQDTEKTGEARLNEVADRGRHIMPFNLEQTTHIFSKTQQGGVQQVIAKDKANTEQISLIREHLAKISHEFKQGDFSNPAKIHGNTMPGLEMLRKAEPGRIKIDYKELADGAEINYATDDQKLVNALHQWFDAQLRDHSRHAVSGHPHHMMHGN